MCDLRQDTCLFGHGGVDPARTQVRPGVFGAFLHSDNCDACFMFWTQKKTGCKSGLRVEFLFKTESGYLRDAEVT